MRQVVLGQQPENRQQSQGGNDQLSLQILLYTFVLRDLISLGNKGRSKYADDKA
jgi:hypothetical protein